MADNVGGYYPISLAGGEPAIPGMILRDITRQHVDGVAFMETSYKPTPFQLNAVFLLSSAASIDTLNSSLMALQGTQINWERMGRTRTDYLLLAVRFGQGDVVRQAVGGVFPDNTPNTASTTAYMVSVEFTLVYGGTVQPGGLPPGWLT